MRTAHMNEENWRYGGRPWAGPAAQYTDGMNLYEYGRSNPLVHTDPLGLFTDVNGESCDIRACRRHVPPPWPPHSWIDLGNGDIVHFPTQINGRPVSTYENPLTSCSPISPVTWGIRNGTMPSGKKAKCATCQEIRSCLKDVMGQWNRGGGFGIINGRHCIAAKNDAMSKCGLSYTGSIPEPVLPEPGPIGGIGGS